MESIFKTVEYLITNTPKRYGDYGKTSIVKFDYVMVNQKEYNFTNDMNA